MTVETPQSSQPLSIKRADHTISRDDISDNALKVLYRLKKCGYEGHLVGGGVRDLLLGLKPKDFDVATDALPEEAAENFKNSRLIGRRFRLLHVRFGREIIEVATFRGEHTDSQDTDIGGGSIGSQSTGVQTTEGLITRDNVYGTLEDDAWRRDFTVNALYYNINDFSVIDYTGGLEDLKNRTLRCIGDPEQRYCEDPVRMLRAIRLMAKLDFTLHPDTAAPIKRLAIRLHGIPPARLFEEVLKLFLSGHARYTFELLMQYGLLEPLFPHTYAYLEEGDIYLRQFIEQGLINTDDRIANGKPVTPAFLFAIMLWGPLLDEVKRIQSDKMTELQAMQIAGSDVIGRQAETVTIPRRFSVQVREIWMLQAKLHRRQGKRAFRIVEQARFRAGYDFLLLQAQAGKSELQSLCDWWTDFQERDQSEQSAMVRALTPKEKTRRRRKSKSQQASQ